MTARTRSHPNGARPSPGGIGHGAALHAIERNSSHLHLPLGLGPVRLPSPENLAWYAGVGVVAALGIIEWPVAAVLSIGHLLAEDSHHRLLRDFGQALEEA